MGNTSTEHPSTPNESTQGGDTPVPDDYASSVPPPRLSGNEQPRLIEEHHVRGRFGEDEIEATDDRGRRWYHLRPEPRGRYDLIGFNYTWWLIWILFIFLVFLPWGRGWGY